jgi:hypothetical protein
VSRARSLALVVGVALVSGVACKRDRTPQRTAVNKPQRTAPPKRGTPTIAGDPNPGRPLSEVFAGATWMRIAAATAADGSPEVVDPPRLSTEDGHFGRTVLAIKRAAFGKHVVKQGESAAIPADELDDLELERASHVFLLGQARTCVAMADVTRAIVLDAYGRELELRHSLVGCGPGPHAPVGFVAERVPIQLGWVPAQCDEDPRWDVAEEAVAQTIEAPARVGVIVFGDEPVVHVLAGDDALHLAIASERGGPIVRSIADLDARTVAIDCAAAIPR